MTPADFGWSGWWIFQLIMPIAMLIVALTMLYLIFGRGGLRLPCSGMNGMHVSHAGDAETATEILKKRYARGEISKDEFDQIKRDLAD